MRGNKRTKKAISICNHCSIWVDSLSYARFLACLQRPGRALTAMLLGQIAVKFTSFSRALSMRTRRGLRRSRQGPGEALPPPGVPCRGRLMQAPFSNKGR